MVKKKTIEKVTKEIDKVVGEEGTKQLEELGGGLSKNLFKKN